MLGRLRRELTNEKSNRRIDAVENRLVQVENGLEGASGKAKFGISDGMQLVESKGMKVSEFRRAQEISIRVICVICG